MSLMTTHDVLGQTVTMPVLVRDASAATVVFDADLEAVRALTPQGFVPVESAPGTAQVAIALVDYRDNDLGAYREVGTILFVTPEAGGEPGTFITHLPVDAEFTCAAGNQIWGFPKSVESIEVTQDETSSRWVLTMDGELVLDLTVPRGGTDDMPVLEMTAYTLLDGRPHATAFTQGGTGSSLGFGEGVTLVLGSHPVAKELEGLGLRVAVTTWLEDMQASFAEPRPL